MLYLLPIALISGILTVFSPCVLPILPIVLASGSDGNKKRVQGVILGLVGSFSFFTLALSGIVTALDISADVIRTIAVFFLVLFGLALIFPIWDKIQARIEGLFSVGKTKRREGFFGGILTGATLGVIWTPCVGPIVATVSTLAAINKFSVFTLLLVFFYAIGLAVPLYLISLKGGSFISKTGVFKKNPHLVRKIFGYVILGTALLIFTGAERAFQAWSLDVLPESWTQLSSNFEDLVGVKDELKAVSSKDETSTSKNVKNMTISSDDLAKRESNTVREKVNPDDLQQGCFGGKDCIPSIDDPVFESSSSGNAWLDDTDLVFGVNINGIQRAYPQRIMNWHEIVNDDFAGDPIAVTFCPLCGTAISYVREVNGSVTELGVSGKLYNSDLVIYDRSEDNYWIQVTGEAITGPASERGDVLERVPTITTSWKFWKEKFPATEVLSRDTGFVRDYDQYPYGNYEGNERIVFPVKNEDGTLHPKEVVHGVLINNTPKAYREVDLQVEITINDVVGGVPVEITRLDTDEVSIVRTDTKEEVVPIRGFWFAWVAFYPDTALYNAPQETPPLSKGDISVINESMSEDMNVNLVNIFVIGVFIYVVYKLFKHNRSMMNKGK